MMQPIAGSSDFDSPVSLSSAGGKLSVRELFRGIMKSAPDAEISYELPSAEEMVKQCPHVQKPCAGYTKRFTLRNDGNAAILLKVGPGGTVDGSMTVPVSSHASHFVIRYSNVSSGGESYNLIRE